MTPRKGAHGRGSLLAPEGLAPREKPDRGPHTTHTHTRRYTRLEPVLEDSCGLGIRKAGIPEIQANQGWKVGIRESKLNSEKH